MRRLAFEHTGSWNQGASRLLAASASLLAGTLRGESRFAASVVVVTRDRATYLDLTLSALERQCFPSDAWELIVVVEASPAGTSEVVNRFTKRGRIRAMQRIVSDVGGAAALNEALAAARGSVVVLLGDDRLILPDFLVRHLSGHLGGSAVVVGDSRRCIHTHLFAPSEPAGVGASPSPALHSWEPDRPDQWSALVSDAGGNYGPIFDYFDRWRLNQPFPWIYFDTGNASVPRQAVIDAAGFDEGMPGWELGDWGLGGTDLAYRLHQAGVSVRFEPAAFTLRQLSPLKPVPFRERVRNLGCFFAKHPELPRAAVTPLLSG